MVHDPGAELLETGSRWTPALGDGGGRSLETVEVWLQLDDFANAEWIRRQWVEKILMKCASKIREARKKGR